VGEVARLEYGLQFIYCKISSREMSASILHGLGCDVFNFRSDLFRGGNEKAHESRGFFFIFYYNQQIHN
jgi:hypothetical protein